VYALLKPWPHLKVSTARADWEDEPWQAKKIIAYAQIAEWTSSSGKQMTSRRVVQYFTGAWAEPYAIDPASLFGIRYDPNGEASDPSTAWKAMLVNMTVTCGRFQVSSTYDVDVTDMENVVLKIDHSTDGEYALEIVDEAQESTDDATYVTLYSLDHGIVTGDTRTNITTMPFYDV
jgi:ABC-type transport system substrate-binding protein